MASAGILFLILMFLISTDSTKTGHNQQQENASKKFNMAKFFSGSLYIIEKLATASRPFMFLLPDNGKLADALLSLLGIGASELNKQINGDSSIKDIMNEFDKLTVKLDQYHVEQKWQTWASGAYYEPEIQINQAWSNFISLLHVLIEIENPTQREIEIKFFMDNYSKYESATGTLYELLTAKKTTFISPIEDVLAEHVKCHEKDIKQYTLFIIVLMQKGNLMNQIYYKYMEIQQKKGTEEILYQTASVMFRVHMKCIADSKKYIENDLKTLIDNIQPRLELAKNVISFLQEVYDRYDWIVVAFITKKSEHKILKTLNRHVLSGFTEVTKEGISVAVARQVKGTYTKAAMVKEAIDKCIDKSDLCYKVADNLRICRSTVEGKPVSKTYTAVHAYLKESPKEALYEDYDTIAVPEDMSNQTPYIYKGACHKSLGVPGGRFVVLIKSDEEIMTEDPCSNLNCGMEERGKCLHVKDMFLGLCECKKPYYGEKCEESVEVIPSL